MQSCLYDGKPPRQWVGSNEPKPVVCRVGENGVS